MSTVDGRFRLVIRCVNRTARPIFETEARLMAYEDRKDWDALTGRERLTYKLRAVESFRRFRDAEKSVSA